MARSQIIRRRCVKIKSRYDFETSPSIYIWNYWSFVLSFFLNLKFKTFFFMSSSQKRLHERSEKECLFRWLEKGNIIAQCIIVAPCIMLTSFAYLSARWRSIRFSIISVVRSHTVSVCRNSCLRGRDRIWHLYVKKKCQQTLLED